MRGLFMGFKKGSIFLTVVSVALVMMACGSPTAPGNPEPARNFRRVTAADMLIVVAWDPSPSEGVVSYRILRQRNDGPFDTIATVPAGVYVFENRVNSYEDLFSYRIITVDVRGNQSVPVDLDRTRIRAADTGVPLAPDSLRANAVNLDGALGVTLEWEVFDADIDYFMIVKGDAQREVILDTIISDDGTRNLFFDDSVEVGVRYSYHVVAVDFNGGRSRASPTASDTPLRTPVLVDPIRGDVLDTMRVEFMWEPVEFAVMYEVVISQGRRELASFFRNATTPVPVYERLTADLGTVANLDVGLPVNWEVYTYSKVDGGMNSVSNRETFRIE